MLAHDKTICENFEIEVITDDKLFDDLDTSKNFNVLNNTENNESFNLENIRQQEILNNENLKKLENLAKIKNEMKHETNELISKNKNLLKRFEEIKTI